MFTWNLFPSTDFQKINLNWIMRKLAEIDPQGLSNPVSYDPQSPDATEQAQARANLGLGDLSVEDSPLPVDKGGTGAVDKATAAMNLESVSWGAAQTLNTAQQQQARDNIGCGDIAAENSPLPVAKGGTGAIDKATAAMNLEALSWGAAQTLNSGQQAQAQSNLGLGNAAQYDTTQILLMEQHEEDNIAVGAESNFHCDIDVTKPGYTPIGIVGVIKYGTNSSRCFIYEFEIDTGHAYVYMRNTANTATTMKVVVDILYLKNS